MTPAAGGPRHNGVLGQRSTSAKPNAGAAGTQAVERALSLLDFVCRSPRPVTLAEARAWAHLTKPTTFRILQALTNCGFLLQHGETRSYSAGLRLFELYNIAVNHLDPLLEAQPELAQLSAMFDETVHMAVIDEGEVVYVAKEESRRAVRMFSALGKRAPAYCTGVGKALLAFADEDEQAALLKRGHLTRYTPTTITSAADLRAELARIRERGYSIDNGEHEAEIRCVAGPVYDATGKVAAAISLTMPASRFKAEAIPEFAKHVVACAGRISHRLGYYDSKTSQSTASNGGG